MRPENDATHTLFRIPNANRASNGPVADERQYFWYCFVAFDWHSEWSKCCLAASCTFIYLLYLFTHLHMPVRVRPSPLAIAHAFGQRRNIVAAAAAAAHNLVRYYDIKSVLVGCCLWCAVLPMYYLAILPECRNNNNNRRTQVDAAGVCGHWMPRWLNENSLHY